MVCKKYLEVKIELNPLSGDLACDVLFSNFECEGVVTETQEFKDLELVSEEKNIVKGFICDKKDKKEIETIIKQAYEQLTKNGCSKEYLGSWNVHVKEIENQDWSQKWKENWQPTKISDKITICPSWIPYKKAPSEIVINIDPGIAFGTGTHATTQICVLALEKYMKKDSTVADIGTGTGILSIIASKLGAKNVLGIDNDEVTIPVAKENAKINNISNCTFKNCEINGITEKFDFITANILHNVLVDIMGDLVRIMKDDSKVVLSGILNTKANVVKNAIDKYNLNIKETIELDQWIGFVVEKRR